MPLAITWVFHWLIYLNHYLFKKMNFLELVNKRQSVRKYSPNEVEQDKIDKIIEAARLAPSASNSQPWHFIVVQDYQIRDKIAKSTYSKLIPFNKFAINAPVLIVVVMTNPKIITQLGGRIKKKEFPLYDIGIVSEHICLQATELGLGSCMMGWFDEKSIRKILRIPSKYNVGMVISLGYPEEGYKQRVKNRNKTDDIVSYNIYNMKSL